MSHHSAQDSWSTANEPGRQWKLWKDWIDRANLNSPFIKEIPQFVDYLGSVEDLHESEEGMDLLLRPILMERMFR